MRKIVSKISQIIARLRRDDSLREAIEDHLCCLVLGSVGNVIISKVDVLQFCRLVHRYTRWLPKGVCRVITHPGGKWAVNT